MTKRTFILTSILLALLVTITAIALNELKTLAIEINPDTAMLQLDGSHLEQTAGTVVVPESGPEPLVVLNGKTLKVLKAAALDNGCRNLLEL